MRVLVAYGTKLGGTEGLARTIAEALAADGLSVDVRNARDPVDLDAYDAAVIGGALYAWSWQKDARRFVKRHAEALQQMPVWLFSSGPLDDTASKVEIRPTFRVRSLMRLARTTRHKTFGGRLLPEVKSPIPTRGDWRDMDQARAWAHGITAELKAMPLRARRHVPAALPAVRRLLAGLLAFTGVTAMAGGFALMVGGTDAPWLPPQAWLAETPFSSYFIPGLLLFGVVGLGNLLAALLTALRRPFADLAAMVAGGAITVFIFTELAMFRETSWLQWLYLSVGLLTLGTALWLFFEKTVLGVDVVPALRRRSAP